ncbi:MAG: SpoIIE family protein phosphatase [Oscillospiraceae bacterium]|nr:SpoIIE family protein phosphatase [Oscillospiraceae bacterium]
MPEKTVREMNAVEKLHHSLAAKIFRATVTGCILLGLVALITGLGLYSYSLSGQIIRHAFDTAKSAASTVVIRSDTVSAAKDVMEIYRNLSNDEKLLCGSEEYRSFYSSVDMGAGSDYETLIHLLRGFAEDSDISYIYIAMYDEATSAMVYIADPDPYAPLLPGDWEIVNRNGMMKFLDWDGTGILYDIDRTAKYGWMCTTGVPIRDESGQVCAFVLADVMVDKVFSGMKEFTLQVSLAVLIITAVVAVVLANHMRKKISVPIDQIAEAAESYVADRRKGKIDTDHFAMLNIRTGDEIENLSLVMAGMEQDLASIEDDLTKITAEKERLSTELDLAQRIQNAMLPHIFPPFPDREEFDLFASMDPAKAVGGDFYDYFLVDDDHLCLVMADVSGKGIPGALFMMVSKIILQSCAMLGQGPAAVISKTNEAICSNNQADMFVTAWVGILELSTGKLTASSAGHEYPIIKKPDGCFEVFKDKHGFVIGGFPQSKYQDYELHLAPGTKLFLYTDGLPEATDKDRSMFGLNRITSVLNETAEMHPKEILASVKRAVESFVGNEEQFDDITMMCISYYGSDHKGGNPVKELTVKATIENISAVTEFVDDKLKELGCSIKTQSQIDIAIDEIVNNIASYAYAPDTGDLTVQFEFDEDTRTASVTFIDSGIPFDPVLAEDPDVTLPAEDRGIGGLGIFLVKKTMDNVSYKYLDGRNMLRIEKKI